MPDWQKGANSAVDVAAAALTGPTLGLSQIAAPLVKQDIGKTVPTLMDWKNASTESKFAAVNPDPVFRIGNAALGMLGVDLFGPSKDWQSFGGRLGQTLRLEQQSGQGLLTGLRQATSNADVARAIRQFKTSVAGSIGGFGAGTGPYDIPDLPGAGGSRHEGRAKADFSSQVSILRNAVAALRSRFNDGLTGDLAQPFVYQPPVYQPVYQPQPGGKGMYRASQPGRK